VLLLDGRNLGEEWHIPVFPLAAIGLLAIAAGRAWRELALRRAEPQDRRLPAGSCGAAG
jgi:hypothetical protein